MFEASLLCCGNYHVWRREPSLWTQKTMHPGAIVCMYLQDIGKCLQGRQTSLSYHVKLLHGGTQNNGQKWQEFRNKLCNFIKQKIWRICRFLDRVCTVNCSDTQSSMHNPDVFQELCSKTREPWHHILYTFTFQQLENMSCTPQP